MAYKDVVLADNPTHFYQLQETSGTVAADTGVSATNNPGDYEGGYTLGVAGPQSLAAVPDKGVLLGGTNGRIRLPHVADLDVTGNLTIEMMFKATSLAAANPLFSKAQAANGFPYDFYLNTSGATSFGAEDATGTNSYGVNSSTLSAAKWFHLALVRSGTTTKYFLNGVLATTGTTGGITAASSAGDVHIGYTTGGFPGTVYASGSYSHVAFWNSALSDSAIATHFAAAEMLGTYGRLHQLTVEVLHKGNATPQAQLYAMHVEVLRRVDNLTPSTSYKLTPTVG